MRAPATTRVTLDFGATEAPYSKANPHAGVDFSWQNDRNIYAPEDAVVTFTGVMGTCGNATELVAGNHRHRMCHQSRIDVRVGQRVTEGQMIGVMGNTGAAQGVHLHWVMWVDGTLENGLDYVNKGDSMATKATIEMVDTLAHAFLDDSVAANPGLKVYVGQDVETVISTFNTSKQRDGYLKSIINATTIATIRGDRLAEIAGRLGVSGKDDQASIIAKLDSPPDDRFQVLDQVVYVKKVK